MTNGDEQHMKHMKTFVRLLTLLLAILMVAMTVVACNDDDDEGNGDSTQITDQYGREGDDLPALNYKNDTVTLLHWRAFNTEYDVEQLSDDNVDNAIYERNSEIERRLNVELKFQEEEGHVQYMHHFTSIVRNNYESKTYAWDMISAYARTEGMLAIQGYLEDLNSIDGTYLNLEKPWWPDNIISTVSIANKMYFVSGDASPNTLYLMHCIYFNKDMLDTYWDAYAREQGYTPDVDEKTGETIASPASQWLYDKAYNGTWCLDDLITASRQSDGKNIWVDNNNNGIEDFDDTVGFTSIGYLIDSFYTGSNLRLIEHTNDASVLKISDDYGSFKTVSLIRKLGSWFAENGVYADNNEIVEGGAVSKLWRNGRALFVATRISEANIENVTFNVGILPVPKYDTNQLNYYTCMGNPFSLYGIYKGLPERSEGRNATMLELTAVLECWASESYRLVTPQVFEVNMQLKYAESQYETDMFEIIRSSLVFDLGRIFANDMAFMSELPSKAAVNNSSWATTYGAYKSSLEEKLKIIVSKLV